MEKILEIGTLSNIKDSFEFMAKTQNEVLKYTGKTVILDFRKCKFSHAVFTSFIGALTEIGCAHGIIIKYRFPPNSPPLEYFKRSGMYDYMVNNGSNEHINRNALPFWKVRNDESALMEYIDNIIDLSKIKIEDNARQKFFKNLYEIFVNANDHSDEQYGVYSCGHWMPKKKKLVFSLYDTGIGIPKLVKREINGCLTDIEAFKWALIKGHSTRQLESGVPRGLGLSDLKEFIELNKGRLTILSNGVYYDFNENGEEYITNFSNDIIGTIVCVTINQDDGHIYVSR